MPIIIALVALCFHKIPALMSGHPSWMLYSRGDVVASSARPSGWQLIPKYPMLPEVTPCDTKAVGLIALVPDQITVIPPSVTLSGPYLLVYVTGNLDVFQPVARMYRLQFCIK